MKERTQKIINEIKYYGVLFGENVKKKYHKSIAELEQELTTKDSITTDKACDCPNGQVCKAFTDGDCEVLQGKQEVV